MINLNKFCSKDDTRYRIQKPWSRGEYTYATNGHICVRVPRLADIEENPKAPDTEKLFSDALAREYPVWLEPPEVRVKLVKCDLCGGMGGIFTNEVCDECDGEGRFMMSEPVRFQINGKEIGLSNIYIALIRELAEAEIGLTEAAAIPLTHGKSGPTGTPVMFRFDGGIGLLMPVRLQVAVSGR